MKSRSIVLCIIGILILTTPVSAQSIEDIEKRIERLENRFDRLGHTLDVLDKAIDDVLWYHKVGDVCFVDKVRHVGPPRWKESNPTAQGAGNPLKFYSYIFIPKDIDRSRKYPLLVFPHGGVHSNFSTYYTHIIREMIAQGYIIIATEYRGSTGYGRGMYRNIDYGGLEVEDVYAGRNYMIENYSFVDKNRVGILG